MNNLFSIGRKAIMVNDYRLNITGQNIANVHTEGYSRQRVDQVSSDPKNQLGFQIGTGSEVSSILRVRDVQLDNNFRRENTEFGYWKGVSDNLTQTENDFLEPSEAGLNNRLNVFFDKWEAVADNPTSIADRDLLVESAVMLTDTFHKIDNSLNERREQINKDLNRVRNEINALSEQIAELNGDIRQTELSGKQANDLRDKFDILVDQLSEYGSVRVQVKSGETVSVYFGSDEIVNHDTSRKLQSVSETDDGIEINKLVWENTGREISALNGGLIEGLYHVRDDIIPGYKDKLDTLASEIVSQLNSIHNKGFNLGDPPTVGFDFFDSVNTDAGNISVNKSILNDSKNIAASKEGADGDNRTALEIADLRLHSDIESSTFSDFNAQLLAKAGSDTANSKSMAEMQKAVSEQSNQFRESVKGVSMNEEAADLIKYQQAFQASAKIVQAAREIISTVLSLIR
ncbi:MAG: flagellar hook-associated protein FlgK [Candidatus Cloacimonadota bacterium]|nr:MAG: flagellar hook-associated protein FlgK [Candidatus Cloacimonadota bacterium]